jgi:hypothetical protein
MDIGRRLMIRLGFARKAETPDQFDRRLGMLHLRVSAPPPVAGMSVFRMMP